MSGPLSRIAATGGEPVVVTKLAQGQTAHRRPAFLPDGRHFLYRVFGTSPETVVGSLDSDETKSLLSADTNAIYVPPGYLLFGRQGTLLAQSFDAEKLELAGEPFPVAEQVATDSGNGLGAFSASNTGILTYRRGNIFSGGVSSEGLRLAWFDRQGKEIESLGPPANYRGVDLSPDGARVAVHRHDDNGGDVWLFERTRGTTSRFTFDASRDNASPIWSPDGSRIAFASRRGNSWGIYQKLSNSAGNDDELLVQTNAIAIPTSWSRDDRFLVYMVADPKTRGDLWILPLTGDRKPMPFAQAPFNEGFGQISPDGRWIAYISDENQAGRSDVFVRPFPSGPGKWPISTGGGATPRWRPDGKELFYLSPQGRQILVVEVNGAGTTFQASVPKELFDAGIGLAAGPAGNQGVPYQPYSVSADGQQFLISRADLARADEAPSAITVVVNWSEELKGRRPSPR